MELNSYNRMVTNSWGGDSNLIHTKLIQINYLLHLSISISINWFPYCTFIGAVLCMICSLPVMFQFKLLYMLLYDGIISNEIMLKAYCVGNISYMCLSFQDHNFFNLTWLLVFNSYFQKLKIIILWLVANLHSVYTAYVYVHVFYEELIIYLLKIIYFIFQVIV